MINGSVRVGHDDKTGEVLGPQSAWAISRWSRYALETTGPTRGITILIPEEKLADRGIRLRAHQFKLGAASSLSQPLRSFVTSVTGPAWTPSSVGQVVAERTIEDLVVGMFLEVDGYAMDSVDLRAGLRGRAVNHIAAGHREPDLTPTLVAEQLGVSLRHLQRAFEQSGNSLTQKISRTRCESAAILLMAPGGVTMTMGEIAKHAGFRSTFELRAGFKVRYGMLPSMYRTWATTLKGSTEDADSRGTGRSFPRLQDTNSAPKRLASIVPPP